MQEVFRLWILLANLQLEDGNRIIVQDEDFLYDFKESNFQFKPPIDMEESQVRSIKGFVGEVQTGSTEGSPLIVIAYKPTDEEVLHIAQGGLVYLTLMGTGLPPHMLSTSFFQATHPN